MLFPLINDILYYIIVYRAASPLDAPGLVLPGSVERKQIKELEAQIHHLDKAHHHAQLGDIYFRQGKFQKAEECYRNALARDPSEIDARSHLGQTLLRLDHPQEALPLLEQVCLEQPKHEYGYTLMALAETYAALGDQTKAIQAWERVTENYSYARARVALAELYLGSSELQLAKAKLQEVLSDDAHAPEFERKHERFWIKRAKKLLAGIRT